MTLLIAAIFVWLLGLCVGSFLNVVIYRLPLGLSVGSPAWSFCPHCKSTLAWRDNLPLLGWLMLGGRCRTCRAPISMQYPIVEGLTGLAFMLAFALLFGEQSRRGVASPELPLDAPLLGAWLVLVAALIVCAATDIVSYMVDTAVTNLALALGVALLLLWPRAQYFQPLAVSSSSAASAAMFAVSVMMLWLTVWRIPLDGESEAPADADAAEPPGESGATLKTDRPRSAYFQGAAVVLAFVGLAAWLLMRLAREPTPVAGNASFNDWPIAAALFALFLTVALASSPERAADAEIAAEIASESPNARRTALRELLWLMPIIVAGLAAYCAVEYLPTASAAWHVAVNWSPAFTLKPVSAAAWAMHGAVIAAAAGWIVRIFFTLVFGMESFGVGDIYILAAAGACAGGDIALLGFLLAVGVALVGWLFQLLLKRTAMIAFGPPLAIGFLIALWLDRPAGRLFSLWWEQIRPQWESQRAILITAAVGILLVAIALARGVRLLLNALAPEEAPPNANRDTPK